MKSFQILFKAFQVFQIVHTKHQEGTKNIMQISSPESWPGSSRIKTKSDGPIDMRPYCGEYNLQTLKQGKVYNKPFDFHYNGETESKEGRCCFNVRGLFLQVNKKDPKNMYSLQPEGQTLGADGCFPCKQSGHYRQTITPKMNCQLCNISFTYQFNKDPNFTIKQCFSVLMLQTQKNGKLLPVINQAFGNVKEAQRWQNDNNRGKGKLKDCGLKGEYFIIMGFFILFGLGIMLTVCYIVFKDRKRYNPLPKSRDFSYPLDPEEMMNY